MMGCDGRLRCETLCAQFEHDVGLQWLSVDWHVSPRSVRIWMRRQLRGRCAITLPRVVRHGPATSHHRPSQSLRRCVPVAAVIGRAIVMRRVLELVTTSANTYATSVVRMPVLLPLAAVVASSGMTSVIVALRRRRTVPVVTSIRVERGPAAE